jgi:hypothetical protein
VELINEKRHLLANLDYLESKNIRGSREHSDYVSRGTCFVAYDTPDGVAFAPSRFLGYQENTFEKHGQNQSKDGRDTNPAISAILNGEPQESSELDSLYRAYCERLDVRSNATGAFGAPRRFWDLRK